MSTDTVFRSRTEEAVVEKPIPEGKEPDRGSEVDVEVPYLDAKNFIEDYFGLGVEWRDHDATFSPDIEKIDGYIRTKISDGEIENSQTAVRNLIKKMEKINNLSQETRSVVKLEVLANYCEFMMKNDNLKSHLRRYANT